MMSSFSCRNFEFPFLFGVIKLWNTPEVLESGCFLNPSFMENGGWSSTSCCSRMIIIEERVESRADSRMCHQVERLE